MAKVTLNLLNIFQLKIGINSIEYEGKTVSDVLTQFVSEFKDKLTDGLLNKNNKKLNKDILILLNGRNIQYLDKYKTILHDGDQLYLSIPLSGG
ncbi:MAG: MoaD/ThiS family protein [Promethearchaeota archaeon]